MRKNLLNLSLLACLLLLSSTVWPQLQKLYINPKAVGNEKQSNFIDSVKFVPLEPLSKVAMGSNMNIQVTPDYFLLTDYPKKNIFVYNKQGKLVSTIQFKRLGNNFYPQYREETNQVVFFGGNKNFNLTPKDAISIEINWNNPRNRKYYIKYVIDLNDTTFTMKKMLPELHEVARTVHFYDDHFLKGKITTSNLYKDSLSYEVQLIRHDKVMKSFFPYNHINEPRFSFTEESAYFSETDTPYVRYVTRPFCDTIYKLVRDSLAPVYQLVLPLENKLPPDFYSRTFKNNSERTNFNRNNAMLLHQPFSFYETPRLILLGIRYLSNFGIYIYNKANNTTYKTANIKGDSTHYNLNLIGGYGSVLRDGAFFNLIKAGDLQAFFEKHKEAVPPTELKAYLQSNPSPESPVVVSFKLKS